jgi:hypothetical protein
MIARKGVELHSFFLADLIGQDQAAFLCSTNKAHDCGYKTLDSIFCFGAHVLRYEYVDSYQQ